MTSSGPPHGEGDHSSTATDRPAGEHTFGRLFASPDPAERSSIARAGQYRSRHARRSGDPADAVLPYPVVPEEERFCRVCRAPVGRGGPERRGAVTGSCPQCGSAFSFVPRLQPREVVAGRYEVVGPLALNSMGGAYLARDRDVSDRWVVLRDVADTAFDRRFLAELDHPNIAKAYDYVTSADAGGSNTLGYLVTEFVGGESVRELALANREPGESLLSFAEVLDYGLQILSAMGYLHSRGLLCGDLTPDNVMHVRYEMKLVGLDAVRRMDDARNPVLVTIGDSAPELELGTRGPSVASDLYAAGRLLKELSLGLAGVTGAHALRDYDSYQRFLRRATHEDPDRRFGSAEEMAGQLMGVLRQIMAWRSDRPWPSPSTLFEPPIRAFGTTMVLDPDQQVPRPTVTEVVAALPNPLAAPKDSADSAADVLSASLLRVRACLDLNEPIHAELALADAQALTSPYDWRFLWYRGLVHLASGRSGDAETVFEAVCDELPGELAPKLALAASAEPISAYGSAHRYYDVVWRTDHAYVSAAFGLARVLLARGKRAETISVLDSVPADSPHYAAAQVAVIKIKIAGEPAEDDLVDAAGRLARLPLAATDRLHLSIAVLEAADRWVRADPGRSRPATRILGWALTERGLRTGLRRCRQALTRSPHASRWQVFIGGLAESLVPVPRRRHRPRRSGWERIEARIHERYRKLGPPEAAGDTPIGKDGHR